MAKPILLIKLNNNLPYEIHDMARDDFMNNKNSDIRDDYHILITAESNMEDDLKVEVFNSDKADDITMNKVKEIEKLLIKTMSNEEH